jgi:Lon protease-like protein
MAALIPEEPGNKRISSLIAELFPVQLAARRDAAARDDIGMSDHTRIPLFVCMLSFPSMPTHLHVFEPRYRLMIRRALESGDRKFGMVMYNRSGSVQGELGATHFLQYGTLLVIDRFELLPDGRSLISAIGVSRFKVVQWNVLDGYVVGKTQRVDDIPIGEEESREAMEMASSPSSINHGSTPPDRLSTQQLLQLGLDYVAKRRAEPAAWLHDRVLATYGQPPSDPALFPYWFASVLPISDDEKYALLSTTSVRERLKITARWVEKLEAMEW